MYIIYKSVDGFANTVLFIISRTFFGDIFKFIELCLDDVSLFLFFTDPLGLLGVNFRFEWTFYFTSKNRFYGLGASFYNLNSFYLLSIVFQVIFLSCTFSFKAIAKNLKGLNGSSYYSFFEIFDLLIDLSILFERVALFHGL